LTYTPHIDVCVNFFKIVNKKNNYFLWIGILMPKSNQILGHFWDSKGVKSSKKK